MESKDADFFQDIFHTIDTQIMSSLESNPKSFNSVEDSKYFRDESSDEDDNQALPRIKI